MSTRQRDRVRPPSPFSRASSPISLLSTTSSDNQHNPPTPRLYLYARLRRGEPQTDTPVAFRDLDYWLRAECLPEALNIPLSLSGISGTRATVYRWLTVFTHCHMFATMGLPADMVKTLRKLLMFLYRTYHEEKGFTSGLYNDVCAAIVHHTNHGASPDPVDQTPWLMALVEYVEQLTGQHTLKDRRYTPGELRVAQELVTKERSYDQDTWTWPCLATELARLYMFGGGTVGVAIDPRHASPFTVDATTVMPLAPAVKALIHHHLALWCIKEGVPVPPML